MYQERQVLMFKSKVKVGAQDVIQEIKTNFLAEVHTILSLPAA